MNRSIQCIFGGFIFQTLIRKVFNSLWKKKLLTASWSTHFRAIDIWGSIQVKRKEKELSNLNNYKNVLNTSAWTMSSMVQCKSLEATFFIAKRRIGTGNFCTKHSFQCLPCTVCLLHSCTAALCQMHLLLWCAPWVPTITVRWLVIITLGIP